MGTVSDAVVEGLLDWGVSAIFGLPGDGINGFVEALRKRHDKIRYIHMRHEEAAAMAACAYAKFTGRLGVCFSTAAPGAVHLLNGLYDAKIDQAPVLAITGMTYHDLIGTHYLQDMNQDYLYQDVAAFNQRIMGPAHVDNMVEMACRVALSHRAVSHLAIPIDFQATDMGEARRSKRNLAGHASDAYSTPKRVPERALLQKAAGLLAGKKKVVILAGAGARGARQELTEAAEKLGAPIVKALLGKDCVPDDSPFTTGGTGVVGTRPSSDALENCDAILIVGSSFPYIDSLPKPGQAVGVQIDDKPERIGLRYPVDCGLVGDAAATLRELVPMLQRNDDRSFLEKAQEGMREWWALMEERGTRDKEPMQPQVVTWNLQQVLNDDAIILGDSGTVTTWIARLKLRGNQKFSFERHPLQHGGSSAVFDRSAGSVPGPPGGRLYRRRFSDDDDGRTGDARATQSAGKDRGHQEQHAGAHQVGADDLPRQPRVRSRPASGRLHEGGQRMRFEGVPHRRSETLSRATGRRAPRRRARR